MSACSTRAALSPRLVASRSAPAPTTPPPTMRTWNRSVSRRSSAAARWASASEGSASVTTGRSDLWRTAGGGAPQDPPGRGNQQQDRDRGPDVARDPAGQLRDDQDDGDRDRRDDQH